MKNGCVAICIAALIQSWSLITNNNKKLVKICYVPREPWLHNPFLCQESMIIYKTEKKAHLSQVFSCDFPLFWKGSHLLCPFMWDISITHSSKQVFVSWIINYLSKYFLPLLLCEKTHPLKAMCCTMFLFDQKPYPIRFMCCMMFLFESFLAERSFNFNVTMLQINRRRLGKNS